MRMANTNHAQKKLDDSPRALLWAHTDPALLADLVGDGVVCLNLLKATHIPNIKGKQYTATFAKFILNFWHKPNT